MLGVDKIGTQWSFHTLTCPKWIHHIEDEKERARASTIWIQKKWDIVMKAMKRLFGKFQYIRVLEKHESSVLHVHLLASFHVPIDDYKTANKGRKNKQGKSLEYTYSASLKKLLTEHKYGYMTSSINLPIGDFAQTVGYATKYMTKEDDFIYELIGDLKIRRILTSRAFGAMKNAKSQDTWILAHGLNKHEAVGYTDMDLHKKITIEMMQHEGTYPPVQLYSALLDKSKNSG